MTMHTDLQNLIARDLNTIWHPCAQMKDYQDIAPLPIKSARGAHVELFDGRKLIDAYASWWCKNLGHGHPRLQEALRAQLAQFEHVALPHTTHPNLVELSERLTGLTQHLNKILFASDGSSAVEIALKLSVHAREILGQGGRTKVLTLPNAYHGETLWTMAVSDLGIFRAPYRHLMPEPIVVPGLPYVNTPQDSLWADAGHIWDRVQPRLEPYADQVTALIVEPILQAAAGMYLYSADFLRRLFEWARTRGIHLIADEVMTGLGRVGQPFAYSFTGIEPDIVCLGKGLTAGVLPMSATLITDDLYHLFYHDYAAGKNFLHSHTHSGNALAVAVALECLRVVDEEGIYAQAQQLQSTMREHFSKITSRTGMLKNIRGIGAVIAADLCVSENDRAGFKVYQKAMAKGAMLRPIGNTLYWCPPLNIDHQTLQELADITEDSITACGLTFV